MSNTSTLIKIAIAIVAAGVLIALLIPTSNSIIYESSGLNNAISGPNSNIDKYATVDPTIGDNAPPFVVDQFGTYTVNISLWAISEICCKQVSVVTFGFGLKRLYTKFCRTNNCDALPSTCIYTTPPAYWIAAPPYAHNISLSSPVVTCSGTVESVKDDTIIAGTIIKTLDQFYLGSIFTRSQYPNNICCSQIFSVNIKIMLILGLTGFCFIGGDCPSSAPCQIVNVKNITDLYNNGNSVAHLSELFILTPPIVSCDAIIGNVTIDVQASFAQFVILARQAEFNITGTNATNVNNCTIGGFASLVFNELIPSNPFYAPNQLFFGPETGISAGFSLNAPPGCTVVPYPPQEVFFHQQTSLTGPKTCASLCCNDPKCTFFQFTNRDLEGNGVSFKCYLYYDFILSMNNRTGLYNINNERCATYGPPRTISAPVFHK